MEKIRVAFEDLEKTEQSSKISFMNTFAEWVKSYVDVNPMPLIGFERISSKYGVGRGGFFSVPSLYIHLACHSMPFAYFARTLLLYLNLYIYIYILSCCLLKKTKVM